MKCIMRAINFRVRGGEEHLKLSAEIGWKALVDSVAHMGDDAPFTALVWPLKGEDPDDAFSTMPYEKVQDAR
jgi:leukotriene-A4 hydrolase